MLRLAAASRTAIGSVNRSLRAMPFLHSLMSCKDLVEATNRFLKRLLSVIDSCPSAAFLISAVG